MQHHPTTPNPTPPPAKRQRKEKRIVPTTVTKQNSKHATPSNMQCRVNHAKNAVVNIHCILCCTSHCWSWSIFFLMHHLNACTIYNGWTRQQIKHWCARTKTMAVRLIRRLSSQKKTKTPVQHLLLVVTKSHATTTITATAKPCIPTQWRIVRGILHPLFISFPTRGVLI